MAEDKAVTTEAILQSASVLAETLGLSLADQQDPVFVEGQSVLVASEFGIEIGVVKVYQSTVREYLSTEFMLNGEILAKQVMKQAGDGWVQAFEHKQTGYYPDGAVIYTSREIR